MTRAEELQEKINSLIEWDRASRRKIIEELKSSGKYRTGLDANQKYYGEHIKEFNRRLRLLVEEYKDLPPDTKITFEDLRNDI